MKNLITFYWLFIFLGINYINLEIPYHTNCLYWIQKYDIIIMIDCRVHNGNLESWMILLPPLLVHSNSGISSLKLSLYWRYLQRIAQNHSIIYLFLNHLFHFVILIYYHLCLYCCYYCFQKRGLYLMRSNFLQSQEYFSICTQLSSLIQLLL